MVAFSPFNHLLLSSCGSDGKVKFYDIQAPKIVKTIDIEKYLTTMSFCPDGHTIAVGTDKGEVIIYDLKDSKKVKMNL